jgi:hypothetical protein
MMISSMGMGRVLFTAQTSRTSAFPGQSQLGNSASKIPGKSQKKKRYKKLKNKYPLTIYVGLKPRMPRLLPEKHRRL